MHFDGEIVAILAPISLVVVADKVAHKKCAEMAISFFEG